MKVNEKRKANKDNSGRASTAKGDKSMNNIYGSATLECVMCGKRELVSILLKQGGLCNDCLKYWLEDEDEKCKDE